MSDQTVSTENIKAVLLVGGLDFGRCPLASRLNRAIWPILGKPALQRLIEQLAGQGVRRFAVCCGNQARHVKSSLDLPPELRVQFLEEMLPSGPAGCIRDAIEPAKDGHILVLPACTVNPPNVRELVDLHSQSKAEMTIFLPSKDTGSFPEKQAQVYVCEPSISRYIPEKGYFDIKEGLVPALVKAGKRVHGAALSQPTANYTNWSEYTLALKQLLLNGSSVNSDEGFSSWNNGPDVWVGSNVQISQTAKIFGPVVIADNTRIADDALVFGPAVIGANVSIGSQSIIEESILWDACAIGTQSRVRNSLIDDAAVVPSHALVSGQLKPTAGTLLQKVKNAIRRHHIKAQVTRQLTMDSYDEVPSTLSDIFQKTPAGILRSGLAVFAFISLIVSYWDPVLKDLWRIWMQSDEYSSGLLIPFIAIYILWLRRGSFLQCQIRPSLWGLTLLAAVQGFRFWGLYYMFDSGERISFVLSIGALVFFLFGLKIFRRFVPVFLFLFLMLPFPRRVEMFMMAPLQMWATTSSVFCLEAAGFDVIREGNIININGTLVAVAEACNGLRMLTAFFVVSGTVVLLVHRPRWEKALVLASSIPVALLCNTIRLTLTAYAFTRLDGSAWEGAFHDFGGLAMMPLAVAMIVFELWLLSTIVIEPKQIKETIIERNMNPREG